MERNGWRQVINRYFRAIALLLMICLLPGVACAEYVGSTPDNGVYLVQSQAHTCTLISATMMLRNYAYMKDSFYEHVVRSETDLKEIRQYITRNPLKSTIDP